MLLLSDVIQYAAAVVLVLHYNMLLMSDGAQCAPVRKYTQEYTAAFTLQPYIWPHLHALHTIINLNRIFSKSGEQTLVLLLLRCFPSGSKNIQHTLNAISSPQMKRFCDFTVTVIYYRLCYKCARSFQYHRALSL